MTAPRESYLEQFFRKRVRLAGGYTIKLMPVEAGIPDRLVLLFGVHFVELKTETGKLSPIQVHKHSVLADQGFTVVTLYGAEQIVNWIRDVVEAHPKPRKRRSPKQEALS